MGEEKWESLEEIYRKSRELEGPVKIPPQIHGGYWNQLQKMEADGALVWLLQECKTYKDNIGKHRGNYIHGNPILGAPMEDYYDPSEEEKRLSEIGQAIERTLQIYNNPEKCRIVIAEIVKTSCIDVIEFTKYTFYHVDVVGSGRFIYPHKGVPTRFSVINRMMTNLNLSISLTQKNAAGRYEELLKALK
ncbi:MAG: hypothetical protein LUQ65_07390 [Candidatus Helarchaeota archaeon]|nr:hypothetical protein [Candidatus Helarchaeota archaeon]